MRKLISVLCIGLMCGQSIAQEIVPAKATAAELTPAEFAKAFMAEVNPKLETTEADAEAVVKDETPFSEDHPYLYASGWTLAISVIGYALFAAIDKAGGSSHTTYNISGDYQSSESNNNGGNGTSDASDTEQNQSGEGSNSND